MLALRRLDDCPRIPGALVPRGEYAPVQSHADDVVMSDPIVEDAFHESMRAK